MNDQHNFQKRLNIQQQISSFSRYLQGIVYFTEQYKDGTKKKKMRKNNSSLKYKNVIA